jgi:dTDP-4-dehydrorhamnose reductase
LSQRHGSPPPIELWAGPECTVNRVGGTYYDQSERSGHAARLDDLDRFAALGVRALRYPVLWERTAPDGPASADWAWADERLGRLCALGIRPIVGLVHHGSGPRHTSLVDPAFATGLAAFARAVAQRYPWVADYTPVNEPLTTARFSGLYGHWYPHGRDDRTFVRALVEQCRGVVLAMAAIREVVPAARLIQTDDLGKTYSTPLLSYQAALENERRWLSWDLLCGRVGREHPLWPFLLGAGLDEAELAWFREHACPPDVVGVNHYLSGERFLDERLDRYPVAEHGGNGRHAYADVLAARVCAEGPAGPRVLLQEAWDRYHLPIAVTEAHNGCTREEQLRWLDEVWQAAHAVRAGGADVRAVTVWSLLGAYDWNTLVTSDAGHYEPGVFDLRAPRPRPTALAHMTRALAEHGRYDHPVLAAPGWWRRPERLWYPPVATGREPPTGAGPFRCVARPILITGATGTLGRAFARDCETRGLAYRLLSRADLDIADPVSARAALDALQPWALVNTAGYVRVDDAEREPDRCFRENAEGVATLAAACAERGVKLLTFSSDLVFDGAQQAPYVETDRVAPLNVYGRSKAAAEGQALALDPTALVVRTSAFFGPWDDYNFVILALRVLAGGGVFVAADDYRVSPTYVPDLVAACLDLLLDDERGVWHLANEGSVTWAEFARQAAQVAGVHTGRVEGRPLATLGLTAPRPAYSVLGSARAWLMPPLDDSLRRYRDACAGRWQRRDVA